MGWVVVAVATGGRCGRLWGGGGGGLVIQRMEGVEGVLLDGLVRQEGVDVSQVHLVGRHRRRRDRGRGRGRGAGGGLREEGEGEGGGCSASQRRWPRHGRGRATAAAYAHPMSGWGAGACAALLPLQGHHARQRRERRRKRGRERRRRHQRGSVELSSAVDDRGRYSAEACPIVPPLPPPFSCAAVRKRREDSPARTATGSTAARGHQTTGDSFKGDWPSGEAEMTSGTRGQEEGGAGDEER